MGRLTCPQLESEFEPRLSQMLLGDENLGVHISALSMLLNSDFPVNRKHGEVRCIRMVRWITSPQLWLFEVLRAASDGQVLAPKVKDSVQALFVSLAESHAPKT